MLKHFFEISRKVTSAFIDDCHKRQHDIEISCEMTSANTDAGHKRNHGFETSCEVTSAIIYDGQMRQQTLEISCEVTSVSRCRCKYRLEKELRQFIINVTGNGKNVPVILDFSFV